MYDIQLTNISKNNEDLLSGILKCTDHDRFSFVDAITQPREISRCSFHTLITCSLQTLIEMKCVTSPKSICAGGYFYGQPWKSRRTTTERQWVHPLFMWKLEKWSTRYYLRSLEHERKLARHQVLLFIGKHASYNLQWRIAVRLVFISYVHRNVRLNISCYLILPDKSNRWGFQLGSNLLQSKKAKYQTFLHCEL